MHRLLDHDPLRPPGGDPADPAQRVVRPVAGRADDRRDRRRPGPAAPPAIPSATSRTASMPASLWAKSTMTMRAPTRKMLSRPGERSTDGRKSSQAVGRPARSSRRGPARRRPRRAHWRRCGGRARRWRSGCRGPGDVSRVGLLAIPLDERPVGDEVRPPAAAEVAADGRRSRPRRARSTRRGRARRRATGDDVRVVAVEDRPAVRAGHPGDRRLDLGQLRQGVDPLQVEVIG